MSEPAYTLTLPKSDGPDWPAQGRWTYEDYSRIPEDGRRYEVIRGFLYVTPAPSFDHQFSVTKISHFLTFFVDQHELGVVLVAPFEIRLPRGIGNPVQPDIVFIRRERQPRPGDARFEGIPDLVVEVLSRGNWRFDRSTKLTAYRDAGVPEVWLVDPVSRAVEVFVLSSGEREYRLRERRSPGEVVTSSVLEGLRIEVSRMFAVS